MGSKSSERVAVQSLNPDDVPFSSSYKVSGVFIRKKSPIYTSKRICELVDVEAEKKTSVIIKSKYGGTIINIFIKVGDIISVGSDLVEIEVCRHPTVLGSLCCDCGAMLEEKAYIEMKKETQNLVSMVHTIPDLKVSKQEAQRLGSLDIKNLLNVKKLSLLVDLDQTLVHTTNDNIPPKLKDVFHFQLMKNGPWYHTRLRPYAKKFLQSVSKMYELHICTFGVREYAHYITHFLDNDRKLFGNRILSRNECLDPMSKKANLSSLFPCGDNLVCIIDDLSDVWHCAPNVVQVIPYHFFKHTGDINAPPGLQKKENDETKGYDFVKIARLKRASSVESSDGEDKSSTSSKKSSNSEPTNNESENDTEHIVIKEDGSNDKITELIVTKENSSNDKITELIVTKENGSKDKITELIVTKENGSKDKITELIITKEDGSKDKIVEDCIDDVKEDSGKPDTDLITEESKKEELNIGSDALCISSESKESSDTNEISTDLKNVPEVVDDTAVLVDKSDALDGITEGNHIDALEAVVKTCSENIKGMDSPSFGTVLDSDSHDSNSNDMTLNATFDTVDENEDGDIVNVMDCDDYLLYLEDVLTRLHYKFYSLYEENKEELPDLKNIIPEIRSQVLKGVNIVFSCVLPRDAELRTSKAYHIATSLGATVSENIVIRPKGVDKEKNGGLYTTHLVAAKLHTEKCHQAKSNKIKIVTPNWLWCCAERWEHCDERIFHINAEAEQNVIRNPPMHCIFTKQQKKEFKATSHLRTKSTDSLSTPSILDNINPLAFFSNDDTKSMEEEVDKLLSDMEEEDKDKESVSTRASSSSSSDNSLSESGSCTNHKRKRKRPIEENSDNTDDDDDDKEENDEDELPSIKFRQGGGLPSDDSANSSDDEDMDAFGDILERELMG